ncbi:UbiD family decarboxylase [Candidatus Korarchaeum cryptofilum]|uniref:Anhydromevalonate phosphate decarboxylase n=1 Tax=Korarchaeum cryptofilum (strain OPF8) TaxID=374847 RepID=B1L6F3_KORCO|nr:UbiD family decarboxylase [Candidatus Korarchaeum cryptofilum]ACB08032.1 Carboxylyase-related protein [Candidatus Korarchaeum cryptofilum OPF8]
MELREAIDNLLERKLIEVVEDPVSVEYEAASYLIKYDGKKALLFKRPVLADGRESIFKIFGGFATSRDVLAASMGLKSVNELRKKVRESLRDPGREPVESHPEWRRAKLSLKDLPILRHYTGEPGPYMTASIVIFRDEGKFSSSYHRMLPISENKLVLRAVEGRKLSRTIEKYSRSGKSLEVAVSIGNPVEVLIASAVPAEDRDKLSLASGISGEPLEISKCEDLDAWAPSKAELVICGRIEPGELAPEGPFYEILGKDIVRMQPVLTVDSIYVRESPIYQAILPAGMEHQILMGLPVEPLIEERVSEVAEVVDVAMTPAGAGWVEVAISIRKTHDDQPALAGIMAISAHKSLKRVIVVDDDVDVTNYIEVMRAVVQRAHIPEDYKMISGVRGSSLDHSNLREIYLDGEKRILRLPQGKMIIDATVKGPRDLTEIPRNPLVGSNR